MSDLISRQMAIDAAMQDVSDKRSHDFNAGATRAANRIKLLPSAEKEEIIRCKDCKYWLPHSQFGFDEDNEEYHDYCERLVPDDDYYAFTRNADDFCSRAERREK